MRRPRKQCDDETWRFEAVEIFPISEAPFDEMISKKLLSFSKDGYLEERFLCDLSISKVFKLL